MESTERRMDSVSEPLRATWPAPTRSCRSARGRSWFAWPRSWALLSA